MCLEKKQMNGSTVRCDRRKLKIFNRFWLYSRWDRPSVRRAARPTLDLEVTSSVGIFCSNPDYKLNIQKRTSEMIENGLAEELSLLNNPSKTILQAIGMNIDTDIESNINQKSYKLAKKQITWFKKESSLTPFTTNDANFIKNKMIELMDE